MKRIVFGAAVLVAPALAWACATISMKGPVPIRGEEALIVWDEATHTEHFVRRAFFENAPADFGFLVPTPTRPELAEVKVDVFARLFNLYQKPVAREPEVYGVQARSAMATPVAVVEQVTVAGLDASVLLANDGKALASWLTAHHYPSSPALTAWLAPYIAHGAYVTAFKLAGGAHAKSSSVRMTFHADAPMFPYSEPKSDGVARPFRLSVLAPTKMTGKLGDAPWTANIGYAKPIDEHAARALLDGVTDELAQKAGWLTVFDEPKSVRSTKDLVLHPAKDGKSVAPTLQTKVGE